MAILETIRVDNNDIDYKEKYEELLKNYEDLDNKYKEVGKKYEELVEKYDKLVEKYEGGKGRFLLPDAMCAICMEGFTDSQYKVMTYCSHLYHRRCIAKWKCRHSNCPCCRSPVDKYLHYPPTAPCWRRLLYLFGFA